MLSIPRLAVKAPVEANAFRTVNDLKAPYKWGDVAWYDKGPRPGDAGNADVVGHLDSTCCPAVFYQLKYLKPGDRVQVQYKTGKPLNFRVMWSHVYWDNQLPLKWIFGPNRQRGLVLITCSGVFHYDGTGYDHKLLVFARLILPSGQLG
jgi:sortase (surface protein transpeptidase)